MLFSQGPWTPWQMFAMGIIGWLAGILYRKGVLRRGRLSLCIFGVIASTIIYGGIMNPASALMWSQTVNWKIIISYYITGIPVDLVRAAATFFPVARRGTDAGKSWTGSKLNTDWCTDNSNNL